MITPEPQNERDELWELLGKARRPEVSPFFARNVVREIREGKPERFSFLGSLLARWKLVVPATALALVATAAFLNPLNEPARTLALQETSEPSAEVATGVVVPAADYEIIAELDELLAYEKNTVWLDTSSAF